MSYTYCKIWVIVLSVLRVQKITNFLSRGKYLKTNQKSNHGCWECVGRREQGVSKNLFGSVGPGGLSAGSVVCIRTVFYF